MEKGNQCPFCKTESSIVYRTRDYNREITNEVFYLFCCPSCGLYYLGNPPNNLSIYYQNGKLPVNPVDQENWKARRLQQHNKLDLIKALVPSGKLLDIGPNYGEFASLAQDEGYNVSVIECDPICVRFMKRNLALNVIDSCDPSTVLEKSQDTFDVICLWQAIEHLPEPWRVLREAVKRLTKHGILVISTPNPSAWQLQVMGKSWPHLDAPRHLFLLSPKWIINSGKELGLGVLLFTMQDSGDLAWDRATWPMWLTNLLSPKNNLIRRWIWWIGVVLGTIIQRLYSVEQRASYTIVLQKE